MNFAARARTHAIAALLIWALASPVFAQAPVTAVTADSVTIFNFAKVNDGYYRGGQPIGEHYEQLKALGIKTVINLTNPEDGRAEEQALVEKHGMTYLSIPMKTRRPPTDEEIAAFLAAVDAGGPVYVHCVGGRHRTGVMTAVYRMEQDGWNADRAFSEMKRYKFGADFLHAEFKRFVYAYRPIRTVVAAAASATR